MAAPSGNVARVRVVLLPLLGGSWVHHAVPPPVVAAPGVGMLAQLRERVTKWGTAQWQQVQEAESGMKFQMKRITTALLRHVTDEEVFLRNVPADAPAAVVLHPPSSHSPDVLAMLQRLAHEKGQLHHKWYGLSVLGLGISIPLMIIPLVPALPFYWNAFRVWGNRRAWLGAKQLEALLQAPALQPPTPCTRLRACDAGECCRVPAQWASDVTAVVVPCEWLAPLAGSADEAALAPLAAEAERALGATGLATHAKERLLAARALRDQHGQR